MKRADKKQPSEFANYLLALAFPLTIFALWACLPF